MSDVYDEPESSVITAEHSRYFDVRCGGCESNRGGCVAKGVRKAVAGWWPGCGLHKERLNG
jgi:hypothetical protein